MIIVKKKQHKKQKTCLNHEREKWDRDRLEDSGKTEGTILKNNCFKECVLFNFHIHIILNSNLLDILVKDVSQSPENNIIR